RHAVSGRRLLRRRNLDQHGTVRHPGRARPSGRNGDRHRGPVARAIHATFPAQLGADAVGIHSGMADTNSPAALHTESPELGVHERMAEIDHARRLAERYRLEFLDMDSFRLDQDLFRSIPAELMLRYGFVPYCRDGKTLSIVVS